MGSEIKIKAALQQGASMKKVFGNALLARKQSAMNPTLIGLASYAFIGLISVSAASVLKHLNMFDMNVFMALVVFTITSCIIVATQMHKIDKYLKRG